MRNLEYFLIRSNFVDLYDPLTIIIILINYLASIILVKSNKYTKSTIRLKKNLKTTTILLKEFLNSLATTYFFDLNF